MIVLLFITLEYIIDSIILQEGATCTQWYRLVDIKLNIHILRTILNRLFTRDNLANMVIDLTILLCPLCSSHIEDCSQAFVVRVVTTKNIEQSG